MHQWSIFPHRKLFIFLYSLSLISSTPLHACGSSTPGEPDPQVHHLRQPPASVFVFFCLCMSWKASVIGERTGFFLPQPWGHCLCFWVKLLTIGWIDIKYDTDIYVYFSMNGVTCPLISHWASSSESSVFVIIPHSWAELKQTVVSPEWFILSPFCYT